MEPESAPPPRLIWPVAPAAFSLEPRQVHLWSARLDLRAPALQRISSLLSPEELQRAGRFRFQAHRDRFVAARGFLRAVLGQTLQAPPGSLRFDYGPFGKPALGGPFANFGLHFNLAHAGGLALLALTCLGPVGVDIERVRLLADADELVARFFSPDETAKYQVLPADQKPQAFFNLWTRKEAFLKATGEGIGSSLRLVEVSFLPGEPAALLKIPELLRQDASWRLCNLAPAEQFAAALAITGEPESISRWSWESEPDSGADAISSKPRS